MDLRLANPWCSTQWFEAGPQSGAVIRQYLIYWE